MSTDSSTGIQSAEIALDVLTRLAELGGAQSVSELGRSLDMPRAKVHRYLVSLERRGYVEQDPASARYRLGPQALHTGLAALAEVDFVKLAADGLDALSSAIGQTVFISIWGQHGPTIVQWRDARLPVTVNVRVGSVLPLLNSATGRVYAAWLPEDLALPRALAEWDAQLRQGADASWLLDAASRRPIPPRPCARTGAPRANAATPRSAAICCTASIRSACRCGTPRAAWRARSPAWGCTAASTCRPTAPRCAGCWPPPPTARAGWVGGPEGRA